MNACLHCGLPCSPSSKFCCAGCATAHEFVAARGLERYYEFRSRQTTLVPTQHQAIGSHWLDLTQQRILDSTDVTTICADIHGIHCSACVWLLRRLFTEQPGALSLDIDLTRGTLRADVASNFDLRKWSNDIAQVGYSLSSPNRPTTPRNTNLYARLGVTSALAINVMILAAPLYFGVSEPWLARLFHFLIAGLATVSVCVGGPVFFRGAIAGLRHRTLHIDVPISIGILLSYAGSLWALLQGEFHSTYFDSVAVFVALMLVGRTLQERTLARHRSRVSQQTGVEGLHAKRIQNDRVVVVPFADITMGDILLVARGEVALVDGKLFDNPVCVRLDWLRGESDPVTIDVGETVPAGAILVGERPARMEALTGASDSPLVSLLAQPLPRIPVTTLLDRVSAIYTPVVVAIATLGGLWWSAFNGVRALQVAVATLVITCPCALGIAIPLAHELVRTRLRREGLWIRTSDALDRLARVKRIVFDKTGTLTTGDVRVDNSTELDRLTGAQRDWLYSLVAMSSHPKSRAVRDALACDPEVSMAEIDNVQEHAGTGMSATVAGHALRFGKPEWARAGHPGGDGELCFAIDGNAVAAVTTSEVSRPRAREDIQALRHLGYSIELLTGDHHDRAIELARRVGIPSSAVFSGMTPSAKEDYIAATDREDTLFVGDGVNDGPALSRAFASGTPYTGTMNAAAHCDFFMVDHGLQSLVLALRTSRLLKRVSMHVVFWAAAYNAAAISVCLAGLMQPVVAAIAMPVSSLLFVASIAHKFAPGSSLWKSSPYFSSSALSSPRPGSDSSFGIPKVELTTTPTS